MHILGLYLDNRVLGLGMENHMEHNMKNEMETVIIIGYIMAKLGNRP